MKIRLTVFAAGLAAVLVSFRAPSIWAQTVTVGSCGTGTSYQTIQAAVDAASPGSTVEICPGNYPEQLIITKGLTLQGVPSDTADAAVIMSPSGGVAANATALENGSSVAAQIFVQNATGVQIQNLAVDGSNNGLASCAAVLIGIYYQNASGTIARVATRNQKLEPPLTGCQSGIGIFAESGTGGQAVVRVQNSTMRSYQKTGVAGNGTGTTITIQGNTVVGQGPTEGAGENGIQIGYGATGVITNNSVIDHVFAPGTVSASGILVIASSGVRVLLNTVGTAQGGIVIYGDPNFGPAENAVVTRNTVFGAYNIVGIEVCGNNNTVLLNRVNNSSEAGINLDNSCSSSGNSNTVSQNSINEACAGILVGTGTTGNLTNGNTFANVNNTILQADGCSNAPSSQPGVSAQSRPSARIGRTIGMRHHITPVRP
jgi:hypothetical protein